MTATAGAGGAYLAEADGATVTASATGAGKVDVVNVAGNLNLAATTAAGDIIANTAGTLNIAGATSTATGNISLSSTNAVTLGANLTSTSGTITIAVNTDGAGAEGFDQKAAAITTGNPTAGALFISVNTAAGGTGNAIIGLGSVGGETGGGVTVTSNGGNVQWSNDPVYGAFGTSQTGLGNGGSNAQTLKAITYNFVTGNRIGGDQRPTSAARNFGANGATNSVPGLTGSVGSGGNNMSPTGTLGPPDLTIGSIAPPMGRVYPRSGANATGHNVFVTGSISRSRQHLSGCRRQFQHRANVVVGGAKFSAFGLDAGQQGQATAARRSR